MVGAGRELGFGISVGLENNVSAPARDAARAVTDLGNTMQGVSDQINGIATNIDSIMKKNMEVIDRGNSMMATGVGLIGAGLAALVPVGLGVKFAGELEMAQIGFTTLLHSSELAASTIKQLRQDAADTPFEFNGVLATNRALIAATGSAEEARKTFLALGNITSAFGQGEDVMVRMAQNLQGIKSSGRATMMDIKQFTNTGIPLWDLLSDHTGATVAQLKEMDITFEMITGALQKAGGQGGIYGNAMRDMAQSINGKFSTLSDEIKNAFAEIGFAVLPVLHPIIDLLTNMARAVGKLAGTRIGKVILGITLAFAGLLVVMGGLLVVMGFTTSMSARLSQSFIRMGFSAVGAAFSTGGLAGGLTAVASATWAALAPMLPYIAALGAIIAIGYILINNMGKQGNAWEKMKYMAIGTMEVFKTWNGTAFQLSQETHDALAKNGVLPYFLTFSTYVVRAKEYFDAFFSSTMAGWASIGDALSGIVDIFSIIFEIIVELFPELGKATEGLNMFKMAGYAVTAPFRLLAWALQGIVWVFRELYTAFQQSEVMMGILKIGFYAMYWPILLIVEAFKLLIDGINAVMESEFGNMIVEMIAPSKENTNGKHNKGVVESEGILSSFANYGDNVKEGTFASKEANNKSAAPVVFDKSTTKTESIQSNLYLDGELIAKKVEKVQRQKDVRNDG